ncbi:hypothetical protein FY036_00415 [Mesorhizobium microcysteis]|uniref:Uncharacterized protein n=1 Tax=Neoaquamicrobium microcysteis TaxID=2682781 RepID=A0A5D4HA07_9HYPH|nr:hypothetical protein [Mesorhizobium microcysteis]TYR37142.1 hypothetical protein FY036_00415 [Mesorhizobium microcysteis]
MASAVLLVAVAETLKASWHVYHRAAGGHPHIADIPLRVRAVRRSRASLAVIFGVLLDVFGHSPNKEHND